jgi:transitional endoplasmic reticulum ATPase
MPIEDDPEHLKLLLLEVMTWPDRVHERANLAEALIRSGRTEEAFIHVGVAFELGLRNGRDASRTLRLLSYLEDFLERESGLTPAYLISADSEREQVRPQVGEFTRPVVTLSDVAGLDDVKQLLDVRLFAPLQNPALAARFGKVPSGGLLMWGPPGCGKTYLARAIAGSLGIAFCSVGLDEVLDMWLGNSEKNLAALFAAARSSAPCAVFLDEADALGGRRSRMGAGSAAMRSIVSVLLTELDGAIRDNSGVFTIGATNMPWDIDPALRRPGRFDRTVFVPPPDQAARVGILAGRLSSVPLGKRLDLNRVASILRGCSGADVAATVDRAVDAAFTQSLSSDREVPVDQDLLEQAAQETPSSIVDWVETATVVAETSSDVELYRPFVQWLRRRDRDR